MIEQNASSDQLGDQGPQRPMKGFQVGLRRAPILWLVSAECGRMHVSNISYEETGLAMENNPKVPYYIPVTIAGLSK